ncbi:MAG: hypothetical protein DRR08_11845 [Candidatus Parabeggiatoa sp. nov. 2]|nr:MAG: hypothetical protein B6247_08645 [Beggiatoa sp. 4572_84]RKZ60255.1 MAG: hypothetical protein DRR08_11845 [Gammaproteobacteria bacterium]
MLTKKIPTQILAIILAMPLLVVYADDNVVCLGDNYEQGLPIPNVNLPTVSLTSEGNVAKIYEGDSLTLFTNATVDTQNGANPNFYWCAEQGQLEIDPTAPDLSQVKYIAPAEVTENTWVRVVVQLSDGLGYVSGKSLFLNVSPITYYFVEGYLYNKYGHTIPDAPVEVAGHTAVTDENGYYKINELRAGNYTLTASKDGYNFTPIEITVGENETNTISLISDDPTPCLLYAVHDEGKKHSQFFTVNPFNAFEVKLLGSLYKGYDIEALDIHPTNNQLFAAAGDDGLQPGHLYKVNSWNGQMSHVGDTNFHEINGLSFTQEGTLWGWAEGEGLIQIDTETGNGTLEIAYDGPVEDITWDNEGLILYGVENNTLLAYNPQAIVLTKLNCTLPDGEVEALEMLPDGRLLFSLHDDETLSIHALEIDSCDRLDMAIDVTLNEIKLNDVEGIAWPIEACIR